MKYFIVVMGLVLSGPVWANDYRPLNFSEMDTDGSNTLSRGEWRAWYFDDIQRRSQPAATQSPSGPTVTTQEGVRTLTRRAAPMAGSSGLTRGDVAQNNRLQQLRDQGLARQGGLSPLEQRDRLRQFGGRSLTYLPTFDEFDLNQDGLVTREEMTRMRVRPVTSQ